MRKYVFFFLAMVAIILIKPLSAEAAAYSDVSATTSAFSHQYGNCKVGYYEVWGYDTTNKILIQLETSFIIPNSIRQVPRWYDPELYDRVLDVVVKVPNTGGVWDIKGCFNMVEIDNNYNGSTSFPVVIAEYAPTISVTYNSVYDPTNPITGTPGPDPTQASLDGSAMQLSWENAATVSKADKTQTLRLTIPNFSSYSYSYTTSSGGAGNITEATTNIPLGAGPYTTVTVIAKKGAIEIGKKSIGIFVQ